MNAYKTGGYAVDGKDHVNGVGNIVTNLQALESLLRGFLVERYDQCAGFPNMGDKIACRNYLTNFVSLGELAPSQRQNYDYGDTQLARSILPVCGFG